MAASREWASGARIPLFDASVQPPSSHFREGQNRKNYSSATGSKPYRRICKEADQARRQESREAAGLVHGLAGPIVRRALHHRRAREETGLLQGEQKRLRLFVHIDEIVLGAPGQEHAHLVVSEGGIAD